MLIRDPTDQKNVKSVLGKDANALVWPRGPPEDEDDEDEENVENFTNQRFMRLGTFNPYFLLRGIFAHIDVIV